MARISSGTASCRSDLAVRIGEPATRRAWWRERGEVRMSQLCASPDYLAAHWTRGSAG